MMNYYLSDTHFNHFKIIEYCNRPFSNADKMNKYMIHQWNSTVKCDDVVYFAGDFAWVHNDNELNDLINKLSGYKHFILGNHDNRKMFRKVSTMNDKIVGLSYTVALMDMDKHVLLHHEPLDDWFEKDKGSIHLHGHIHNTPCDTLENRYNISAEVLNYTPMTLEEVISESEEEKDLVEIPKYVWAISSIKDFFRGA